MTTGNVKIRVRNAAAEVEYEGDASFLADGFDDLFEKACLLGAAHGRLEQVHVPAQLALAAPSNHSTKIELGMGSVAAKLSANSGPELVIAAAAYLTLVKGESKLPRKDILSEMRNATAYFKESMASNLSASLTSLVKSGRLNEISKEVYALSASELSIVEPRLAQ